MILLAWLAFALSTFGTILNIRRRRSGFALWAVANAFWALYNARLAQWPLAAQFGVYLALAVWGWFAWRPAPKSSS